MLGERTVFVMAVLAVVVAALVGPASAEEPYDAKAYFSPMVIPAAAFINDGVNIDGFEFHNGALIGNGVDMVNMVAPVYLPQGATIHSFRAYLYDNDNDCDGTYEDIDLFLNRTSLVTGAIQPIAIATSVGASGSMQFVPTHTLYTSAATVNNDSYQYWIHMRICSLSHRLKAVVIEY
ncbi:MAG: hypothetical protein K8R59_07635 [Thermoanaerobaculales bacterium]|nr:hypothetical protein [Thermoanaerobaculales bacterium]